MSDWIQEAAKVIESNLHCTGRIDVGDFEAVIRAHAPEDLAVEVERLRETVAMMPKTCDGHPYLPFVDTRTFYCIYRASDETPWRKTTCKVVVPDEQMDSDQIWEVDISGDDAWYGELFECLVFVDESLRDKEFVRLTLNNNENFEKLAAAIKDEADGKA